jgi:TolB protein
MLFLAALLPLVVTSSCKHRQVAATSHSQMLPSGATSDSLRYTQEKHFRNVRQLTYGGNNAEAYWSYAGDKLIFQSDNRSWGLGCDQIFILPVDQMADSSRRSMISNGKGRTTCSWFMPGDRSILFASTHLSMDSCPPVPVRESGKYVWPIYPEYDIFEADMNGKIIRQMTKEPGYDAEATVSPKGDKIVFTSTRSGDLDLWIMNIDGTGLRQITQSLGYDGGAAFSPDGKTIVWRASRPDTPEEVKKYRELLEKNLVEPTNLEIFVADVNGSNVQQVTSLGQANWAPYFHPSGKKILFCSNHKSAMGFPFNIFMVNLDGSGLEQITFDRQFDSFLMFSPDGKRVSFCSNRNNGRTRDTNVFVAEWVD